MDAASAIGTLATEIGGDKGQKLQDTCMRIYEACNFQDLATQRITRVIKLIRAMEGHITNLIKLFKISDEKTGGGGNGASLLNGPALPQDAISQSDVDALFKSLGG
jgi:chemotaxis protein CheZ